MIGAKEITDGHRTRLTELPSGAHCQVVAIERKADLLAGFCIYPGARLQLRQKYPALVIAAEDLEFALEEELARAVWVVSELPR